jgi:hypothetical protein
VKDVKMTVRCGSREKKITPTQKTVPAHFKVLLVDIRAACVVLVMVTYDRLAVTYWERSMAVPVS